MNGDSIHLDLVPGVTMRSDGKDALETKKVEDEKMPNGIIPQGIPRRDTSMADHIISDMPEELDNLVTCPICKRSCDSPRLLPCYHSVCRACLESHITEQISSVDASNKFPCPRCSCPTYLPPSPSEDKQLSHQNYADRFEPDIFVDKLTHVLSALKDGKTCDLCERRHIKETAADWCMECLDAMCQGCLKVHLAGKTTGDHTMVSLEELGRLPLATIMRRGVQQACRSHPGETVRFYCMDCSLTVCVQCLTLSHRKCERCLPLDETMTSMGDAVADVMVRLRAATTKKEEGEGVGGGGGEGGSDVRFYQSGAQVLEESVKDAEEKIRSLASDLRQAITDKEQELLERLHSVASQLQEKVGDFRDLPEARDDDVTKLRSAHARLEALVKYGSDVEVLEMFQTVQEPLAVLEAVEGDISGGAGDEVRLSVKFSPEDLVQAFRRDFQSLGEIDVQDSTSDDGLAAWGVAVTDRDDIIVVDCRNRRVQKFGLSGDLLDHIQVSNEPRDVTYCGRSQNLKLRGGEGEEEVAVTLVGKQIYIITVSAKMALKRRFKTSKQYDSIAFCHSTESNPSSPKSSTSGVYLVSSLEERCVDVISQEGDVLKTFGGSSPPSGTPLFLAPRYVGVTREGHFTVSDSGHNCVVCFTQNGDAEFRYGSDGPHTVASPQGVCGDKFGNLFLADYGNSRVHMVIPDGRFDRFVLGPDSGLRRPVAIAMTPRSSKLVLVQSDGVVKVFSYADTKVKMKVPCWCPRCSTSTDDGEGEGQGQQKQGEGQTQNHGHIRLNGRSRASSHASSGSGSGGGGSRASRSGSESYGPLSPSSPVFHTPHLNGRAKRF